MTKLFIFLSPLHKKSKNGTFKYWAKSYSILKLKKSPKSCSYPLWQLYRRTNDLKLTNSSHFSASAKKLRDFFCTIRANLSCYQLQRGASLLELRQNLIVGLGMQSIVPTVTQELIQSILPYFFHFNSINVKLYSYLLKHYGWHTSLFGKGCGLGVNKLVKYSSSKGPYKV